MENIIFYKLRKYNDKWVIVFLDNNTNNYTIIKNDLKKLRAFINSHKESILVGANNYITDDKLLTSLIKNGNLDDEVTDEDITELLPITLDITQGIVRNSLIDFNNMICNLKDNDGNILNYDYALNYDDIEKQLVGDIQIIKSISEMEDRKKFLEWKLNVIKEYNLSKDNYRNSYGNIMRSILGLEIDPNKRGSRKISLDKNLERLLKEKNDPFLNSLFDQLKKYYCSKNENERLQINIDGCLVNFNEQGIKGSIEENYVDTNGKNAYLYIDFNSFGPNILINNNWLDGVAKYPERYSEVKDLRIFLKSKKQAEQMYYKYLLNSGLDYLTKVNSKDGKNVGLSLTLTGVMTMMLLYRNIKEYGIKLIECNTDGLIVKCPIDMIENVKAEVKNIEDKLSLSCDVDVINKIVHFDTMNYAMQFTDGKIKHLGVFGNFQEHPLYCSGIRANEMALREYYLNGVPIGVTLRNLRDSGDLEAFQIVKKQKKNERDKYLKVDDDYILYDRTSSRLFAVREDLVNNPFYTKNTKGVFEEYKLKRTKSVKDGFYHFEVSDNSLPSVNDLDLSYYFDECYKVINSHPTHKISNIKIEVPKINIFFDIDGTTVEDRDPIKSQMIFCLAIDGLIKDNEVETAYELFSRQGGFLVQFLSVCKKYKGYGTIDNFAKFLMSKNFLPGRTLKDYKQFVTNYLKLDKESAKELKAIYGAKELLKYLKSENCNVNSWSNWFKIVQKVKLDSNELTQYVDNLFTIDEYYAKSSLKAWDDTLQSANIDRNGQTVMIGNGSSDIAPKTLEIPSIIINQNNRQLAKTVLDNGIIITSFKEIENPNFFKELRDYKSYIKRK